jgi:hypothetical protein
MKSSNLTDLEILKRVRAANTKGNVTLAIGRAVYLDMPHSERVVLNECMRRFIDRTPLAGVTVALEVLTAASMAAVRDE